MNYKIEELAPIVGKLADKYTAYESTSISYEKAEQLMGAVLYCIREGEQSGENSLISAAGISAQKAYEIGRACVEEKVKEALRLYNAILPAFSHYENRCLYDAFIRGVPEFFKWYDIRFAPQNTVLTLDYPVLKDLSGYTGIDKIYEWIRCIGWEQTFLRAFPDSYVLCLLSKYNGSFRDMTENLCEAILPSVVGHILAKKPFMQADLTETDRLRIQEILMRTEENCLHRQLMSAISGFLEKYGTDSGELPDYISGSIRDTLLRLKNAAPVRTGQ